MTDTTTAADVRPERTYTVTAADVKDGQYVGSEIDTAFGVVLEGHLDIAAGLGWVRFVRLCVRGRIRALAGSGIKAGSGLEAGEGIKAGLGLKAGLGIKAGSGLEAGEGIEAGLGIEAGSGIKAGSGLKAGWGLEAGEGIEAGWGIEAGLSITCAADLHTTHRVFAGLAIWKAAVTEEESRVTCRAFHGILAFGALVETDKATAGAATEKTA